MRAGAPQFVALDGAVIAGPRTELCIEPDASAAIQAVAGGYGVTQNGRPVNVKLQMIDTAGSRAVVRFTAHTIGEEGNLMCGAPRGAVGTRFTGVELAADAALRLERVSWWSGSRQLLFP